MEGVSRRLLILGASLAAVSLAFLAIAFLISSMPVAVTAALFLAGALLAMAASLIAPVFTASSTGTRVAPTRPIPSKGRPSEEKAAETAGPAPTEQVAADGQAAGTQTRPLSCEPEFKLPATLEPHAVLQALLEGAQGAGNAVAASLWLEDPPTATMRMIASVGQMPPSPQPVPVTDPVLGKTASDKSARIAPVMTLTENGVTTTMHRYALPLAAKVATAVAAVDFRCDEPPDAAALTRVSAVMSGALAGAAALHLAGSEADAARELFGTLKELSRRLDPDEVVRTALARAMLISEAATGSIMLVGDTGRLTIAASEGLPADIVETTVVSEGEGIAGWVYATGKPLLIEDLPGRPSRTRRRGVRSAVTVPIGDEDGIIGVLNVGSREFPARFTEQHMEALEVLVGQTAVALRNARAVGSQRELYFSTLRALAIAMETKDPYARGETERVSRYATAIASAMGLEDTERQALEIASLVHDLGMTAAGDSVQAVERPLTTVERGLIKMHPAVAAEVLKQVPALEAVVPIVYHHHESYDGTGYVSGIAGEAIPIGARILAVADAFEAMTSDRPYRPAKTTPEALRELEDKAGSQFDPYVVEVFSALIRRNPNLVARR